MKKYKIFGHEIEKETLKIFVEFALLVAVMMLAYNIGQYDSLQYQKMFEKCEDCSEYCKQINPFPEFNLTKANKTFLND